MKIDVADFLQKLMDSDIWFEIINFNKHNFKFTCIAKNGMYISFLAKTANEGLIWLGHETIKIYPASDFSKWWNQQKEQTDER